MTLKEALEVLMDEVVAIRVVDAKRPGDAIRALAVVREFLEKGGQHVGLSM